MGVGITHIASLHDGDGGGGVIALGARAISGTAALFMRTRHPLSRRHAHLRWKGEGEDMGFSKERWCVCVLSSFLTCVSVLFAQRLSAVIQCV
jgi:hypothetical protein